MNLGNDVSFAYISLFHKLHDQLPKVLALIVLTNASQSVYLE